jgi:hypothetical protein
VITFDVCAVSFTDRSGEGAFSVWNSLKCYYLHLTLQAYLIDGNISQVKNEWDYASTPPTGHSGVDTYYVYQVFILC